MVSLPLDVLDIVFRYYCSPWVDIEKSFLCHHDGRYQDKFVKGYSKTIIKLERQKLKLYYSRKMQNSHFYHYTIFVHKKHIFQDLMSVKKESHKHYLLDVMLKKLIKKVPTLEVIYLLSDL